MIVVSLLICLYKNINMNNDYQKWLAGDCCCANNFIHIETPDCGRQDVCDCERILLEISNLHTDDLVLQEEIDELSGQVETKLDASAYTPTDLSDYYTKEEVDELIPSGGSITVDSELSLISNNPVENKVITEALNDKLDASAYTPVSLSGYATEEWVETKGYLTEHQPLSGYVPNSIFIQYIANLQQQIDSLTAAVSGCCGSQSGETQYRWITMTGENDYWCSGTTKMSKEKEQSSTDGINWTDTGNIRSGSTVLEENCIECGYSPVTGDNKYVATTTGGTTISGACCEPDEYDPITCDELDLHEIAANTGQLRTINVGPCTKVIGNGLLTGEYNLTDVVIPSSVTAIKNTLLEGCTAMQTLAINRETPPAFHQTTGSGGVGLFSAYPDAETIPTGFKIYVPASAVNTYKTATIWSRYANYIFAI